MCIIYLLTTNAYSGAENIAQLLAENMLKKHNVYYACPTGSIEDYLEAKKIPYIPIKKVCVSEVWRLKRMYNPDLFHTIDYRASLVCSLAGVSFVAHLHQNPLWLKKVCAKSFVMLFFSWRAKKVICVSDAVVSEFVFAKKVLDKFVVIENVIDKDRVIQLAGSQQCDKKYDIGFVGRLDKPKDPERAINIIEAVSKQYDINAVLVGDGVLRAELESMIQEHKMQEKIQLEGFQNNPYTYMRQMKLMLMPSKWEGFGLTAVEAMLLGCPVIASDVGGLRDVLREEPQNLCKTDEDFIQRICSFLGNKELLQTNSEAAKKHAQAFCNVADYVQKVEYVYHSVLL